MLMGNASKILQTVSANVDRDVIEESLLQLFDLLMLTDKSGLLTGEERVTVTGVAVAIQRETLRQRQIEFLTATNNPTDMKIMGLKGRATVLRSVSTTIGMPGDDIVPTDDKLDQMEKQQQQEAESGGIDAMITKAVNTGVESGVKRITTELTAGVLATRANMGEGPPAHVGTPGQFPEEAPGGGQGGASDPGMHAGMGGDAAHAQGNQPPAPSNSMGPQTHLSGFGTPGVGGKPTGGVG